MYMLTACTLLCLLLSSGPGLPAPSPVQAQPLDFTVQINSLDDESAGQATVHTSVLQDGRPILGLDSESFTVYVDDQALPQDRISASTAAPGVAVMVLVDISGSMDEPGILNSNRLQDGRQLARQFVEGLNEEDWVGLIGFGSELTPQENLTYDHGRVLNTIQRLPELAGPRSADRRQFTHLFDAVVTATELLTDNPDSEVRQETADMRKLVVVFSDGNDVQSDVTRLDAQREAREEKVSVYSVTLCSPPNQGSDAFRCQSDDVRWLSSQTNGKAVTLESTGDQASVTALLDEIYGQRSQYRVNFPLLAPRGDHTCVVEVAVGDSVQTDQVTCNSKILPPQIQILAPASETTVTRRQAGPLDIDLGLTFPDSASRTPDRIEYYINGRLHETIQPEGWDQIPSMSWDLTDLPGGEYTVMAVIHDPITGEQSDSQRVKVSLEPFLAPQITLSTTVTEVQTTDTAAMTFTVDALFPDEVPRDLDVVIRDEGQGTLTETIGAPPFLVTWSLGQARDGRHLIVAEAQDPRTGRLVRSNEVAVLVRLTPLQLAMRWLGQSWYWLLSLIVLGAMIVTLWRRKPAVMAPVTNLLKPLTTRLNPNPVRARLVVVRGPQVGEYPIRDQITTMGRDADVCNLVIQGDPAISGRHASILMEPAGDFFIRDEGSSNGTFLNHNQQVPYQPDRLPLRDGDIINMGQTQLQFVVVGKSTRKLPDAP